MNSAARYSGSAWYADEHWRELERRCAAHVNVDLTGGMANGASTCEFVRACRAIEADAVEIVGEIASGLPRSRRKGTDRSL